mmetsp:Transcript_102646/g.187439  ORF Transcript_102646/g.187439 Transcript_102646/m.187439 type:complete len:275 (+) Transcript_102646:84-908(+)
MSSTIPSVLLLIALAWTFPMGISSHAPASLRGVFSQPSRQLSGSVQCSFMDFPVDHTIPANAMGNSSSVYPQHATTSEMNWDVDLAGLWWMMGNPLAEEFVSFKGTVVTSSNDGAFPKETSTPSNLRGQWVWPKSIAGTALMSYYALTEEPTVPQRTRWTNSTYAVITPIAGGSTSDSGFQYVLRRNNSDPSGDTWIRENLDSPDDDTPEYIYTLVRVIDGDGTPNNRWWPAFLDYAAQHGIDRLQMWGNDNSCMRACETVSLCSFCKWWCGVE